MYISENTSPTSIKNERKYGNNSNNNDIFNTQTNSQLNYMNTYNSE